MTRIRPSSTGTQKIVILMRGCFVAACDEFCVGKTPKTGFSISTATMDTDKDYIEDFGTFSICFRNLGGVRQNFNKIGQSQGSFNL